jgi:carbamoyl-phosphate synthase large subunit
MKLPICAAVTGIGNPLGQNIFKALEISSLPLRLYVLDSHPLSAGFFGGGVPVLCPRADAPGYVDELIEFLRREEIAAVFFGTEAEPAKLRPHRARIEAETGTILMVNNADVLAIAEDKYLTACALAEAGLDHPASAPADDAEAVEAVIADRGFPLIAKPRKGSASRGLARILNRDQLEAHLRPGFVIQECLLPDDAEYTVGIYRCRDGRVAATTVIHRDLDFGLTYRGVIRHDEKIASYAEQVMAAIGAVGSGNVQLRLTARGPVCFEVNPRFSSTTPVRAYFGVNEPELAIREYLLGEILPRISARAGAVMREWREIYLEVDEAEAAFARDLSAWKGTS